ncbi:hypothetical protein CP532_1047 [Ophiocordyceps camponoti-leonardi (nom. inval.)]|nr:hypothetical protein CP532_1047 [Ophiocordyceps camponoti-leonardi (nom. inval.)]
MPTSLHPQAKFDPLPPDIDIRALVDRTPNFRWVQRVSRSQIRNLGPQEFEKLVQIHVIAGGKPLVIDGWDAVLPKWLFNVEWLEKTYDKKRENVRDIPTATDIPMTTGHYLRSMRQLANQWTPHTYRDDRRQRLYLKDIDCPLEWRDALQKVIHPGLFYLNENVNVSSTGGRDQEDDDFRSGMAAAPAGDLMSSLPETMRAENLMCYIGHEGTYTPAHREMCASLGQNIMVETSGDGEGERPGSSIWFMTESKDREVVREYFLSMLGHDIEIEKHFAQVNAWKKAPFDVYIVEQRAGDFILIPPLAAHQVWNRGTRTMKVAWNRTTVETLDLALHEALPRARLVCRDEQYKNKAIIYFTLQKYFKELQQLEKNAELTRTSLMGIGHEIARKSSRARQLADDFKRLFALFTEILMDEAFAYKEKEIDYLPFDSCVTSETKTPTTCAWSVMLWDDPAPAYLGCNGSFEVARLKSGKKSVAQICQEALRRRPWKDITKQEEHVKSASDSDPVEGDDRSKKKPKRKKKKGEVRRCHVCCHKDYSYRVHECSNPNCTEAYCYGVLYRAFDLMPQRVLEDEHWQCPKCLGICSCGSCRRSGNTNAYTPKNTLLGHDTRPIADDRSVEALVDFRVHNLSWLKAVGEESRSKDSRRMQRLREQANNAKAQDRTHEAEQGMSHEPGAAVSSEINDSEKLKEAGSGDQNKALRQNRSALAGEDDREQAGSVAHEATRGLDTGSPSERVEDTPNGLTYPDPSIFMRQRIGMGYYEQDDTPDKILFDPYQAPSADAVSPPVASVPDFVKKSIRAAKRKARRENEDPDFVVGRSYHKRPRFNQHSDLLESMDPALFEERGGKEADERAPVGNLGTQSRQPSETLQGKPEASLQRRHAAPRFDANEPSLRHAKPLASYVELEDADMEEFEEVDQGHQRYLKPGAHATVVHDDAVDDTTKKDLAMPDCSESRAEDAVVQPAGEDAGEDAARVKTRKRRGRPPRRTSMTTSHETQTSTPVRSVTRIEKTAGKRGRGRPRKSANLHASPGDEGETQTWNEMATESMMDSPQARFSTEADKRPENRQAQARPEVEEPLGGEEVSGDEQERGDGLGNWCNAPHVGPSNYAPPAPDYKLQYVELIHRHHKRTPYASNSLTADSSLWNCDDAPILHLIYPLNGPQPAFVYRQEFRPQQNYWKSSKWNGSCAFPQITTDGLRDSWQHGNDLYDVYHGVVGLLPARHGNVQSAVRYRATNNAITQQVAAMVIGGMWRDTGPFPLLIQPSGIDSLEPQYDCPAAREQFSSVVSDSNEAWRQHLTLSAQLFRELDNITGVHPLDAGFHSSFDHYFDTLSARQCHSMTMPCKSERGSNSSLCVSTELADAVFRNGHWEYNYIYRGHPSSLAASAASFGIWVGELTTNLRDSMAGSSKVVYSHNVAHDGSIARLLSILQLDDMRWPGMGAEIVFELYKRQSGPPSYHRQLVSENPVRRRDDPLLTAAVCFSDSAIPTAQKSSSTMSPRGTSKPVSVWDHARVLETKAVFQMLPPTDAFAI